MDYRTHPKFDAFVGALEQDRGLPSGTLRALVGAESGGKSNALSPVGAQGLTQFMPATAKQYNVDVSNPWDSLRGTADYLHDLMGKYDGNIEAALSHYNGGAYNARYFVDGTAPDASRVSAKNHEVNKGYVAKIAGQLRKPDASQPAQGEAQVALTAGQVEDYIAQLANTGEAPVSIVEKLSRNPTLAPIVRAAEQKGYAPEDIVARMGGSAYAGVLATQQDVNTRGAIKNAWDGAGYAVGDAGRAVSQLGSRITGNDAALAQKQAEQAALENDVERRAVLGTTAGTVGNIGTKVAPALVAGAFTGGSSILGQAAIQGGIGAAQGALTPTTGEGQLGRNVAMGGALGAVGGGAGTALTKLPGAVGGGIQRALRGGQSSDELAAARDALIREGIDPSAADISARAASTTNVIDRNIAGATLGGADKRILGEQQIARAITSRIGTPADELSSAVVKQAQKNISTMYDEALDGVTINLDSAFSQRLDDIVQAHTNSTVPSLASKLPASVADDLKVLVSQGSVSARQLQSIRSSLGREMSSGSDSAAKASLGDIRTAINEVLETRLPAENLAKFQKANEFYRNLQPVENYVRRTNDSGSFSAKKFLTSTKAENRAAFERGEAPFQDLMSNLAGAQAPGAPLSVDPLTKAVGLGALAGPAGPLSTGLAGNLAMRILTDPRYRDVLLGLNPVQRAQLMQQAAAARVGGVVGAQVASPQPQQATAQIIPFRRAA